MGKTVEFAVGMIFTTTQYPDDTSLVVGSGEKNILTAQCRLIDGVLTLSDMPGSLRLEIFGETIGKIEPKKVENLLISYYKNSFSGVSPDLLDIIHQTVSSPPRRVDLP